MSMIFLLAGVALAVLIVVAAFQQNSKQIRIASAVLAAVVLFAFFTLASFRYVSEDSIGIISKNIGFKSLAPGKIIATDGEKGPQAKILPPGWHPWFWPFVYDIAKGELTDIPEGSVGLLTASDGLPLPPNTTYAPEWDTKNVRAMAQDAEFFLTKGGGYKGPQTTVLKPGKYRLNPNLFKVKMVPVVTIKKAMVGVVKSNVGVRAVVDKDKPSKGARRLVERNELGIWREPLLEGQYYYNTNAYEITEVSTKKHIVRYTAGQSQQNSYNSNRRSNTNAQSNGTLNSERDEELIEEREIIVRTSDGFTFPVDVRIEFEIHPVDAPLLVAVVGDDQVGLRGVMNSAVRAIFRNNAESVKALDYV